MCICVIESIFVVLKLYHKDMRRKHEELCSCRAQALIVDPDEDPDLSDRNVLARYQSGTLRATDDGGLAFVADNHPLTAHVVKPTGEVAAIEFDPETGRLGDNSQGGILADLQVEGGDPQAARVASRIDWMRNSTRGDS